MKKLLLITPILLMGCTTPVTVLENTKTGEVVTCGGGVAGSLAGGLIGYKIQESNDKDCVDGKVKSGYKIR